MKLSSVEAVTRALDRAGVPFIVVGGLAVVAHGYGRLTRDLDLVIRLEPHAIRAAFTALAELGYQPSVPVSAEAFADPETRSRLIDQKGMTVLNFWSDVYREMPIDVFAAEPFDFHTEYELALVLEIEPGLTVRVLRLEALLRLKLASGRTQDIADVQELRRLHAKD